MKEVTMDNLINTKIDVFAKFNQQLAVVTAGTIDDFNAMTIGWGMMGNVWGHPGSAITIYVSPDRYTHEYLEREEYFTISFFSEKYRNDVITLGRISGRDENKINYTSLTPVEMDNGVGFKEAELTFLCKKIYEHDSEKEKMPAHMQKIYETLTPHTEYTGYIEDVKGFIR